MIKTRINNEYKDVIKIFGGGILQKEITKVWSREANKYVYESEVEYTGTLPITITANGNALLDYQIYGNTVQTGTPTPESPVDVVGCGERTENLFDEEYPNIIADNPRYKAIYVGDGEFTLSTTSPLHGQSAVLFFFAGDVSSGASTNSNGVWTEQNRTVTAINGYVTVAYRYYINTDPRDNDTMLNPGSTALPYEPYGYKLPMTIYDQNLLADNIYPIYIGENQLTENEYVSYGEQKIYKLVGEGVDPVNLFDKDSEDIMIGYEIIGGNFRANSSWMVSERIPVVSGYKYINEFFGNAILQYTSYDDENPTRVSFSNNVYIAPNNVRYIRINCIIAYKTIAKFYRNLSPTDPPVPLPQIPTIDGTTIIDYDGDPKPSQMYVKYRR